MIDINDLQLGERVGKLGDKSRGNLCWLHRTTVMNIRSAASQTNRSGLAQCDSDVPNVSSVCVCVLITTNVCVRGHNCLEICFFDYVYMLE